MKNLILYFPIKNNLKQITTPYQDFEKVKNKQEALLLPLIWKVKIYMARGEKSHTWGNKFLPHFQQIDWKWSPYTGKEILGDLTLGFKIPKGVTNIFDTIRDITLNKTILEKLFPKFFIPSIVCNNYEEILENSKRITSKIRVLKPQNGTRSQGIFIQEHIPEKEKIDICFYPYLLQEFFDTSWWFYSYPGLHDFRVILLNGEIIGKFLRQPEKWKYTANSFRKWKLINLKNFLIPKEMQEIIKQIESYCKKRYLHRYYSIDFWIGPNREIKIFEMNSAPGLTSPHIAKTLGNYIAKNILQVS